MNQEPKYPNIEVQLTGKDGNAFFIIGTVRRALRRAGLSEDEVNAFSSEASSDNYDNVFMTCLRWVTVL
jgi:hypothetical protein